MIISNMSCATNIIGFRKSSCEEELLEECESKLGFTFTTYLYSYVDSFI